MVQQLKGFHNDNHVLRNLVTEQTLGFNTMAELHKASKHIFRTENDLTGKTIEEKNEMYREFKKDYIAYDKK